MVNDQINWLTISAPASCDKGSVSGLLVAILFVMILDMPQASPVQHSEAQRISAQHSRAPAWAPSWAPARVPARVPAPSSSRSPAEWRSSLPVDDRTARQPDSHRETVECCLDKPGCNPPCSPPLQNPRGGCVCATSYPLFLFWVVSWLLFFMHHDSPQASLAESASSSSSAAQSSLAAPRVESSSWQPES